MSDELLILCIEKLASIDGKKKVIRDNKNKEGLLFLYRTRASIDHH